MIDCSSSNSNGSLSIKLCSNPANPETLLPVPDKIKIFAHFLMSDFLYLTLFSENRENRQKYIRFYLLIIENLRKLLYSIEVAFPSTIQLRGTNPFDLMILYNLMIILIIWSIIIPVSSRCRSPKDTDTHGKTTITSISFLSDPFSRCFYYSRRYYNMAVVKYLTFNIAIKRFW